MREIDSKTLELMRNLAGSAPMPPRLQKTYEIEVVTPMFGGGVEVGKNDDEGKLIRETSIRGMLRFWYRATVGARYQTSKELFDAESKIFGTTDSPSQIKVRVSNISAQAPQSYGSLSPNMSSVLGYALFPFAPNPRNNTFEGSGKRSRFDLSLSYPKEYDQEVEITLWAWLNFGGIGARTRRGCGALFCKEFAPDYKKNNLVWRQKFASATLDNSREIVRKWSTLGSIFLHPQTADPQTVWKDGIGDYKCFRQGVNFARNSGQTAQRPGRSRWPEPDALRLITETNAPQHKPYIDARAFPRAELGAPIVFHFKDKGDPKDVNLCPNGSERASSPIIIKPLLFDDGKTAASCVVFLNGPRVEKVVFGKQTKEFNVVDKKNSTYRNSPLKDYSSRGSALEGFKNFIEDKKGYEAIR